MSAFRSKPVMVPGVGRYRIVGDASNQEGVRYQVQFAPLGTEDENDWQDIGGSPGEPRAAFRTVETAALVIRYAVSMGEHLAWREGAFWSFVAACRRADTIMTDNMTMDVL